MHWLSQQLDRLDRLAAEYRELRGLALAREVDVSAADAARRMFFEALGEATTEIHRRPGIDACFVSHEGLLCEKAGESPSFEALAAFAQSCVETARHPVAQPLVGGVRQMVILGDSGKLALFCLGSMAVGIRCGLDVNLARILSA
jgi:predicted regulator of Ras-like GTPase activity (Roadblock/LC7/MglB family)